MIKSRFLNVCITLIFVMVGLAQSEGVGDVGQLTTPEEAVEKAIAITGFDRLDGFPAKESHSAEIVEIAFDSMPFVAPLINGRRIWRVSLVQVPLLQIRPGSRPVAATFEVLIDPDNGKLLKIHSRYVDTTYVPPRAQTPEVGPPRKIPKGDGDSAVLHLIPVGPDPNEKDPLLDEAGFAGLPETAPCPLLDVMRHSSVNMGKAIWIDAVYVLQKTGETNKAQAVWKVWLNGHPDVVTEASRAPVAQSAPVAKETRTYLQTLLITADGTLAECLSAKMSKWITLSGDLPPAHRRLYERVSLHGEELSVGGDDQSTLYIVFAPPGELLVTDPAGRKTGIDPIAQREYRQIPRSDYYDESIGDPEGTAMMRSMSFDARQPLSGDYQLTITGTDSGAYELYVSWYDISGESSQSNYDRMPIAGGVIHTFTFSFNRLSASRSDVTGGFVGNGEESREANGLLSYVNIGGDETKLLSGTSSFGLLIIYGKTVLPETFMARLNGEDISDIFSPAVGKYEMVNIGVQSGENVLVVNIGGSSAAGQTADSDTLILVVE